MDEMTNDEMRAFIASLSDEQRETLFDEVEARVEARMALLRGDTPALVALELRHLLDGDA